jgi:hypothetical protein
MKDDPDSGGIQSSSWTGQSPPEAPRYTLHPYDQKPLQNGVQQHTIAVAAAICVTFVVIFIVWYWSLHGHSPTSMMRSTGHIVPLDLGGRGRSKIYVTWFEARVSYGLMAAPLIAPGLYLAFDSLRDRSKH